MSRNDIVLEHVSVSRRRIRIKRFILAGMAGLSLGMWIGDAWGPASLWSFLFTTAVGHYGWSLWSDRRGPVERALDEGCDDGHWLTMLAECTKRDE